MRVSCPLVHWCRRCRDGLSVVLIGHRGHPEVEGTMGRYDRSGGGRIHLVETLNDVAGLEVEHPDRLCTGFELSSSG